MSVFAGKLIINFAPIPSTKVERIHEGIFIIVELD